MTSNNRYVLNFFYKLRHDIKRSYILSSDYVSKEYIQFVQIGWISQIHPVLAMALSLFSEPASLQELKNKFSYFFDISETEAEIFVKLFLNNEENFIINYEGKNFTFPKNIVIEETLQFSKPIQYTPEQFVFQELDWDTERFYEAPISLVFMVNNECATDCVYCYANKSVKAKLLPFERMKSLLKEANELHITKFTLVGGEVFLYKHWKELLSLLKEYGLNEKLISTKIPIGEKTIASLKTFGLKIQISLDSVNPEKLQSILNVNSDYAEKMRQTIKLLEKYSIKFQIATILTKYNSSISELNDIFLFLKQFSCLQRWEIRIAFKSLYSRGDFDQFRLSRNEINEIDDWIKNLQKETDMNILWMPTSNDKYFKGENGSRSFDGARCSANYSNLFILPDGKVTICEQLYWNPRFIVGDLNKQTIKEIWNSPKSLALSHLQKEDFREDSICRACKIFDDCMSYPNRCFADILKGYGDENWDYPDPRCIKAPAFTHNLLNE